ncbi:hypothetical protein IKO50_02240 [bacterium]|nr:hypothetical protein [bacterium]
MTFDFILLKAKRGPIKITIMETKEKKEHGAEIKFSAINPLELWNRLGLGQSVDSDVMDPQEFENEEARLAYEAFRSDFGVENRAGQGLVIPSEKGSIFIWSLLKAESKRAPNSKLSSKKFLFKDKLFGGICKKANCKGIDFSEKDFEDVVLYLEGKRLVKTSVDGIRMTKHFTDLFHEKYRAWLVF